MTLEQLAKDVILQNGDRNRFHYRVQELGIIASDDTIDRTFTEVEIQLANRHPSKRQSDWML